MTRSVMKCCRILIGAMNPNKILITLITEPFLGLCDLGFLFICPDFWMLPVWLQSIHAIFDVFYCLQQLKVGEIWKSWEIFWLIKFKLLNLKWKWFDDPLADVYGVQKRCGIMLCCMYAEKHLSSLEDEFSQFLESICIKIDFLFCVCLKGVIVLLILCLSTLFILCCITYFPYWP